MNTPVVFYLYIHFGGHVGHVPHFSQVNTSLLSHKVGGCLNLLETPKQFYKATIPFYISTAINGSSNCSISMPTFDIDSLNNFNDSVILSVVLICSSLMNT